LRRAGATGPGTSGHRRSLGSEPADSSAAVEAGMAGVQQSDNGTARAAGPLTAVDHWSAA